MAKNINTNSKEWCDLIFDHRNKKYGAYKIRLASSKRHVFSYIIVIILFSFIAYLPTLIDMIEFYVFQHTQSDYVVEDYNFISESLTEAELKELSKQFIPNPAKTEVKSVQSEKTIHSIQDIKFKVPVIVDATLVNDAALEDLLEDTTATESKVKDEPETETDDGLYTIVEEMPAFPGGEKGLMDFIYKNLRYPYDAASKKIESCVICTFIVDTRGLVTQVEIVQSAHPLLNREALRLVRNLPPWRPGKQHGKPVRVKYTLPIVFRLK